MQKQIAKLSRNVLKIPFAFGKKNMLIRIGCIQFFLGKSFDITYIRIVFYSPRPESFAIYKRQTINGPWIPYQYYRYAFFIYICVR